MGRIWQWLKHFGGRIIIVVVAVGIIIILVNNKINSMREAQSAADSGLRLVMVLVPETFLAAHPEIVAAPARLNLNAWAEAFLKEQCNETTLKAWLELLRQSPGGKGVLGEVIKELVQDPMWCESLRLLVSNGLKTAAPIKLAARPQPKAVVTKPVISRESSLQKPGPRVAEPAKQQPVVGEQPSPLPVVTTGQETPPAALQITTKDAKTEEFKVTHQVIFPKNFTITIRPKRPKSPPEKTDVKEAEQ